MSTSTAIRPQTFISEGPIRYVVFGLIVATAVSFVLLPKVPDAAAFNAWILAKTPVIHGTILAVMSAFVAALLTIWTLMKTRSTRYIERLAESHHFNLFIRDFEVRLVFGAVALLLTSVITIAGWALSTTQDFETGVTLLWALGCALSIVLLCDSLLTARVLL